MTTTRADTDVANWLIRDLVEQFPDTMPLLASYGIDLCCGGGREGGEALDLHGAPREETLAMIGDIIASESPSSASAVS